MSTNGHTLEKADSVSVNAKGKYAVISTMIDVDFGTTKKFTTNIGSGGKYSRITVVKEDEKYDLKIRNRGSKIIIQHSKDDNEETKEITVDD